MHQPGSCRAQPESMISRALPGFLLLLIFPFSGIMCQETCIGQEPTAVAGNKKIALSIFPSFGSSQGDQQKKKPPLALRNPEKREEPMRNASSSSGSGSNDEHVTRRKIRVKVKRGPKTAENTDGKKTPSRNGSLHLRNATRALETDPEKKWYLPKRTTSTVFFYPYSRHGMCVRVRVRV